MGLTFKNTGHLASMYSSTSSARKLQKEARFDLDNRSYLTCGQATPFKKTDRMRLFVGIISPIVRGETSDDIVVEYGSGRSPTFTVCRG